MQIYCTNIWDYSTFSYFSYWYVWFYTKFHGGFCNSIILKNLVKKYRYELKKMFWSLKLKNYVKTAIFLKIGTFRKITSKFHACSNLVYNVNLKLKIDHVIEGTAKFGKVPLFENFGLSNYHFSFLRSLYFYHFWIFLTPFFSLSVLDQEYI